jgi:hypothetical protein
MRLVTSLFSRGQESTMLRGRERSWLSCTGNLLIRSVQTLAGTLVDRYSGCIRWSVEFCPWFNRVVLLALESRR